MRGLEHAVSCETLHRSGGLLGAEASGWGRFTPGPALSQCVQMDHEGQCGVAYGL